MAPTFHSDLTSSRAMLRSMRSCQCYQDREVNDYNSKGLDAFQNQEAHVSNPTEHVIGKHGHRHHANSLR